MSISDKNMFWLFICIVFTESNTVPIVLILFAVKRHRKKRNQIKDQPPKGLQFHEQSQAQEISKISKNVSIESISIQNENINSNQPKNETEDKNHPFGTIQYNAENEIVCIERINVIK